MSWDLEYDAVLVGGGVGSLTAAIRLVEAGLEPIVVEKSDLVGGGGAYSGGIVWAPDNHRMRAKGLGDSAAAGLEYLGAIAGDRWDPDAARTYVERVGEMLLWLEERTPVRWITYPGLPDYFAELPGGAREGRCLLPHPDLATPALEAASEREPDMARVRPAMQFPWLRDAWAGGRALVGCLWARVLGDGTERRFRARATDLVVENGSVTGVVLDGRTRVAARRGVLLNTGGFEWDADATRRHVPGPAPYPQTPPSNEGDGHAMASAAGAAMALMDETIWMPSVRVPGEEHDGRALTRLLFQELALPHSLVVDRTGRRFANETFFQALAAAWVADPGRLPCWFLFDDEHRERYGFPAGLEPGGYLTSHESLADLAAARGIDADGLRAQVADFNAGAAAGVDTAFGRGGSAYQRAFADPSVVPNPTVGPVARPPFYCVELYAGTSGHRGGAVTDSQGAVCDTQGRRIRGLYACGNAAAGLVTGATYITGTSIGPAIVFGALAADAMAA